MAFPDATALAIAPSKDQAKAVIDQVLSGGHVDPAIAEALRKIGPGYMLVAGAPGDLDDPDDPDEPTDLEGLTLVAFSISANDASTSTTQIFLRFASIAQATAGAAWMQDPENFQGDLFGNFGDVNVQVRQDQAVVVAQFEIPNDKVVEGFFGN